MAGTEVGRIYYQLDLDSTQFKKGVATASTEAESFGSKLADVGKKAAIAFAVIGAGAVAFGISSVKAFQESQDAIAQTNAVLKSTGGVAGVTADQVTKLATALQKSTTYSDEQVRSVENLLLTFTSLKADVMPQATKVVLDMATALGTDTKSASIQVGKALQDPINGISALKRVGVNFSDAQKAVISNLVETGQTAQAQQLILKELNNEFGGSASAKAQTFAGRVQQLKNSFNDLQEAVGEVIVNAIAPFVMHLSDIVNAIKEAGGPVAYLTQLYKDHQTVVVIIAGALFGLLVPAIVAVGVALWGALYPLAPFLIAGALIGLVVNQIAISMGGWHVLIDTVKTKITALWTILETLFKPSIMALYNAFKDQLLPQLERLYQTLDPALMTVLKIVAVAVGVYLVGMIYFWINAMRVSIEVLGAVISVVSNVIQWFINLYNWGNNVASGIVGAFMAINRGVVNALNGVINAVGGAIGSVNNTIAGWFNTLYDSGRRLIESMARGIADGAGHAVQATKDVLNKVRQMLPFSDAKEGPLSDLTLSGRRFSETFAKGITGGAGAITDSVSSALDFNGVGGAGQIAVGNGGVGGSETNINNQIGNVHINNGVDGEQWIDKLTRQDQIISMGLSG